VDSRAASGSRYTEILSQFMERLKLESVVLCDSGGLSPLDRGERIFIWAFVQFFGAGRRGAGWFAWAFERYYRKVLAKEAAREERERIIRSVYEIAPVLEQAWRSFARPEENLAAFLPQIHCSVLLAWAKDDIIIQLKHSVPSFEKIPDHRLEISEGGTQHFWRILTGSKKSFVSFFRKN
jgi:pimeloyl-ACP methyl ester carboxylesterase